MGITDSLGTVARRAAALQDIGANASLGAALRDASERWPIPLVGAAIDLPSVLGPAGLEVLPGAVTQAYAQLGDVTFGLLGPLTGLGARRETTFAQHPRIGGAPRLQATGDQLEEITLELAFDRAFGNPALAALAMRRLLAARAAVPFSFATGEVRGQYVLRALEETLVSTDSAGYPTRIEMRARLLEYVGDVAADQATARTATAATARASARRVRVFPHLPRPSARVLNAATAAAAAAARLAGVLRR